MFNKKTYRINKLIYKLNKNLLKNYNTQLNFLIIKNKRNKLLTNFFLFNKKNTLNKNICSVTGKYKSIFNSLKISRHVIHKYGSISQLPNYSKLSW